MAKFVGGPVVIGDTDDIHDSALNALGTRAKDAAGNEYIYLQGVANVIAGSWVSYDEAFQAAGLDTDVATSVLGFVAIAQAAVGANQFGWFLIDGSCPAGAGTVADNAKVFPTATVFICDDTGTAGLQIVGAVWRSADNAGLATVQVRYPFVGVNVA
jgi:hypothetical protein